MNEDVKREWIEALTSGEFKQGQGQLRDADNRYCCLGVLCEIAVRHNVIPEPKFMTDYQEYAYGPDEDTGALPDEVVKWAELPDCNPVVPWEDHKRLMPRGLASVNDGGVSFEDIADIIKNKPFIED